MPTYEFGSGVMWATPMIDLAGNNVSNPTPIPFGAMQDVSLDIAYSVKELYGLYQFPLAVARGTAKLTGKAKIARFQARLFNQVFGETLSANEIKAVSLLAANTGAANNYNTGVGSNFYLDLGIQYANGVPMNRNTTPGSNGQYAVNSTTGIYTFNASENNTSILVSYAYYANNTAGNSWTINNQLLGLSPFFKLVLNQQFQGKQVSLIFNQCVSTKLTFATKLEDFHIPEFDFSMMADANSQIGFISVGEQ